MRSPATLLLAACVVLAATNGAAATLPDDVTIEYAIHQIPTDADSEVIFVVTLYLTAQDQQGDAVGWSITRVDINQPGAKSTGVTWTEYDPYVDTVDGLWWVEHVDVANPALAEFLVPPLIEGLGQPDDTAREDLSYAFNGDVYLAPPGGAPYENTAAASYSFDEGLTRLAAGEEEPAESDGSVDG